MDAAHQRSYRLSSRIIAVACILAIIVVVGCGYAIVTSYSYWTVSGSSMHDTYEDGDILIGRNDRIQRGDVVVIDRPKSWSIGKIANDENLVKRVIAVPGDILCIEGNGVISSWHGCSSDHTGFDQRENAYTGGCTITDRTSIRIPDGYVWLRGDNVDASYDSRYAYCHHEDPLVSMSGLRMRVHASIGIGRATAMVRRTMIGGTS